MARGIAHHFNDKKRTLYGRDALYLRNYVGTHVIAVLAADNELQRAHVNGDGSKGVLSPGMRLALGQLVSLAIEE